MTRDSDPRWLRILAACCPDSPVTKRTRDAAGRESERVRHAERVFLLVERVAPRKAAAA